MKFMIITTLLKNICDQIEAERIQLVGEEGVSWV
jgi:hypothetical protein